MENKYTGNDNYGKPKADYITRIQAMDDVTLQEECKSKIWLSAYAANNLRSDFHWQCDACGDECHRRGKPEIYGEAYARVTASL